MTIKDGWVERLGEVPVVPDEPRASMEAFARFKGGGPAWASSMHELYVRRERELRRLKRRPGPDDHKSLVLWVGVGYRGLCAADGCAFVGPTRQRERDAQADSRGHHDADRM